MQQLFDEISMDGLDVVTNMIQVYSVDDAFQALRAMSIENKEQSAPINVVLDMSTKDTELLLNKQVLLSLFFHHRVKTIYSKIHDMITVYHFNLI